MPTIKLINPTHRPPKKLFCVSYEIDFPRLAQSTTTNNNRWNQIKYRTIQSKIRTEPYQRKSNSKYSIPTLNLAFILPWCVVFFKHEADVTIMAPLAAVINSYFLRVVFRFLPLFRFNDLNDIRLLGDPLLLEDDTTIPLPI